MIIVPLGVSILEVFGIAAIVLLALVGVVVAYVAYHIWKIKRAFGQMKTAMKDLGAAFEQGIVPDSLGLEDTDDDALDAVEGVINARQTLEAAGFRFGGCYVTQKMPGVVVATFADPSRGVTAAVTNTGEMFGVVIDMVTMYEDGSAVTHRTLPSLGFDHPPQFRSVQVPNGSADEVLTRHLAERDDKPYRSIEPEDVADAMEEFNDEIVRWRTQRGGFDEAEVRRNLQIMNTPADDEAIKMLVAASRIEAEKRAKENDAS